MELKGELKHVAFFRANERGTNLEWDRSSTIHNGDLLLYLGEKVVRFIRYAEVFSPKYGSVGYVKLDHLVKVGV